MDSYQQDGRPTRPQRPPTLSLDLTDYVYGRDEYFPPMAVEGEGEGYGATLEDPPNPFRDAAEIPESVRSLSRDSAQFSTVPFGDFSRARDSLSSSAHSVRGLGPRSPSSRSPLAGPPSLPMSPAETFVGSPDPSKDYLSEKLKAVVPFKSQALLDLDQNPINKPWIGKKEPLSRISYWLTYAGILFMGCSSALLMLVNLTQIENVGNLCLVLDDGFDNGLDRNTWYHEVDMGGFGNGEFEMMTNSENNSYVEDGILYIVPTLTSDVIGKDAVFDGHTYNITGCTNTNLTACGTVSNSSTQTVVNPVQSARLHTRFSHSITYGRVEVKARLPRGDWLWPAIWMLPMDYGYGPWPMSGEIDIMESRGNGPEYPYQGREYVRTSLNWGPNDIINSVAKTFGWFTQRRVDYSDDFHTYVLEWSPTFLRSYIDTPMHEMFNIKFDKPFFERGQYEATALNGTEEIAITNPWAASGTNSAPFDQSFYLILNLAVGGRNGWFPDTVGGKMWYDEQDNAMYEFARAQEQWSSTWPADPKRRGMAVDYVKMWQRC